jgi:hypothetical protein
VNPLKKKVLKMLKDVFFYPELVTAHIRNVVFQTEVPGQ